MVSGQLEDSLRHEIESYIDGRLSGVKQEISALQSQLNEALSRLLERQSDVQLDGSVAASIMEHLRAAHEQGINLAASESSRAQASSDMAIVKAAISEIDEQKSQADILKILVNRAASFRAARCFRRRKKASNASAGELVDPGDCRGDNAIHPNDLRGMDADTAVGDAVDIKRDLERWPRVPF